MNDFIKIRRELKWILCNYTKSDNIDEVNKYYNQDNQIGNSLPHIKRKNYRDTLDSIISSQNYYIAFNDLSLIHLYYVFDENNNVCYSCLTYLPFVDNELNENQQLSKYLRVDYSPDDYVEIIHSKCHMHIGIDKNDFRIPVQTIIYPKEFIFFILKYIYKEQSEFSNLIKLNNQKENLLSAVENNLLRLMIG